MSVDPFISLSVVSHGQGHMIRNLLQDMRSWTGVPFEVIVTLNIPEDREFLAPFDDLPMKVIENDSAQGFGANHNRAFDVSRGQVFAIVNPDIRSTGLDLAPLVACLADDEVAAVAPRVLSPQGTLEDSARRFPTLARLFARVLLRRREVDYDLRGPAAVSVDWVAGMFVVFRHDAFKSVGGFDERYFMYMEDADICRRLRRRGFDVVLAPGTSVIHDAQRASRRSMRHLSWHLRSALRFLTGI